MGAGLFYGELEHRLYGFLKARFARALATPIRTPCGGRSAAGVFGTRRTSDELDHPIRLADRGLPSPPRISTRMA